MTILGKIDEQIDALQIKLPMNIYETDFYKNLIFGFSTKVIHQNLTIGIQNYMTGTNRETYPTHFHLMALYILYEIMKNADNLEEMKV